MRKILLGSFIFLLSLLFLRTGHDVFAAGDVLLPAFNYYQVDPGESFEFDYVYKSQSGGKYILSIQRFSFDQNGEILIQDDEKPLVSYLGPELSFERGEEKYLELHVNVPDDVSDGEYYYRIAVINPDTGTIYNLSLASLLYLSVGEASDLRGEFKSAEFIDKTEEGTSGNFYERLFYQFEYGGERAFILVPILDILYRDGTIENYEGNHSLILPRHILLKDNWYNPSKKDFCLSSEVERVTLRGLTTDGEEISRLNVPFSQGYCISGHETQDPPLNKKLRQRRYFQFLYYPIFRIIALSAGLALLFYSFYLFYPGKK